MRHKIYWTSQKIKRRLAEIEPLVYKHTHNLPPFHYKELEGPMAPAYTSKDVDDSIWETIPYHSDWGLPRINFTLRTTFNIPASMDRTMPIALFLPIGIAGDFSHPEALAYINGQPHAACDRHHQEILLKQEWCDGKSHQLALHGWTGIGGSTMGDMNKKLKMLPCAVVQIHQGTRDFIALTRVALGISDHLEENQPARHHLLTTLDDAFIALDLRHPVRDGFYKSVPKAYQILKEGIDKSGQSLDVNITAVGHAHIDIAWLWTLDQTRQKAGRTFHNVLRLMEQFPEFNFSQSQPLLYDYVRQDFPELFKKIKERITEKHWEPIGGMWVEADCNLSGPESLVRQFLLGRNFFRKHFGKEAESPVLWLPDVFGYTWNLPQLIKEAGMEYFFTIKIGWNQYNRLPYDSFWWQGLDGTQVLTHFSTTKNPESPHASTYNADASPGQTLGTWFNFQQKDYGAPGQSPPLLMSYGWGDGGGGPTREMLENIREMRSFPATPQIQTGSVKIFFQKLDAECGENLPTWNGELYLEYHRGTYTTQARIKRANRKSEFLLHDAEFVATYAALLDANYKYPTSQFSKAWELICLNQFHDIIPGTSIGSVYDESLEQYKIISELGESEKDKALETIAKKLGLDFIVVNPTSFFQNDIVLLPEDISTQVKTNQNINGLPIQQTDEGLLIHPGALPPYSFTAIDLKSFTGKYLPSQSSSMIATSELLENAYIRIELNQNGDITRIFDKENLRDVLPKNTIANQFQAFEDRPLGWDAWDIDIYYEDKMWLSEPAESVKVVETGPLRVKLEITRRILNSAYTQTISLTNNSLRIDFKTNIDWQERKILLKTAFPVDVLSPTATYEIQWGNVERPTHRNTSWDWARFETAAQKWVDLSEGNYGVSLLNDCKYGHDIFENTIRLSLLRGTTAPDPDADLGKHYFAYSLFPHSDKWNEKTIAEAYTLNDPLIFYDNRDVKSPIIQEFAERSQQSKNSQINEMNNDGGKEAQSLLRVDQAHVIIETIKQAEDGNGIIVRLYESQRKRGGFILTTAFPIHKASLSNILEEEKEALAPEGNQLNLTIQPYQILTIRLQFDQ